MEQHDYISYLEKDPIQISPFYYYHAFSYNSETFKKMLKEGLKAKILLLKKGTGYNGLFYISLSRKVKVLPSAYSLLQHLPAFIIAEDIKTIKTKSLMQNNDLFTLKYCNTFLPFRMSAYGDEYQRFLTISPQNFKAIRYDLSILNSQELNYKLFILQQIVNDLEQIGSNLDIVDTNTNRILDRKRIKNLPIKNPD